LQVLQLVAAQPEQELPPTGAVMPLSSVVKLQNRDSTRSALPSQPGQVAPSADRLTGRSNSNLLSQSPQTYS
jgi:hypothetical protein